ncbi:MAG: PHP domain-containing protein [Eubacterium sp.]|nr:PHP domain-containing protein [Eubacterium sp.]
MKADLHCHTTLSDGSLGIEETIAQAKRYGIDYFALTDHDTLASSSRAVVLGERYGIKIIPAVEFSCYDSERKSKVHIICYNPQKPDRLEGLCLRTCELRKKRGKQMAMKVLEKYPITLESIIRYATGSKVIFKCHIMHALMDYGYTTDLYGKVYDELFDAQNGLCAQEVSTDMQDYPEVHFVLELIHSAGGIAVMAHPKVFNSYELLDELAENKKIDGVEVWHSSADDKTRERLLEIAQKYDLITTGGSDFHGFYNHYPIAIGTNYTPDESLKRILREK